MSAPKSEEEPQKNEPKSSKNEDSEPEPDVLESSSSSESSSDSDSDSEVEEESDDDADEDKPITYVRPDGTTGQIHPYDWDAENIPEVNIPLVERVLNSKRMRTKEEDEEESMVKHEDLFDFPPDPENWREEDLMELWADAPLGMTKPGWDPSLVDDEDVEIISDEIRAGRDPPIAPFYLPYRKPYPAIPDNHYDIKNPKSVIEELDRIEEFLTWVSFIFPDGSTYEGTVWDDQAHGKGVFVAEQGLVRYEGEWLRNEMEGHGVVEVEIPIPEPVPGSKLEAKMRAEGRIISRDFMSPEDRKWLEMDIEDTVLMADGEVEIPFYENEEWVRQFGQKPEKGRYKYAGQWKHGRMHGCGVYEVNERITFGRFYFGELLEDAYGCDADISTLHAGIAEVAAAKARMFINKPDGMVREYFGPYSDPQHPYLYEEDDVWMAPGFINQFYEVPDYWKMYVQEVDQEREMWLNSFYKAPLRLPMPSELEYWWSQDHIPEFILINKEPEPDPDNPGELVYTTDPLILHTPTGRIINYVDDEEYGIRLFWQPELEEGEEVDPDKVEFLPLGFDEFYGRVEEDKKDNIWTRFATAVRNVWNPFLDRVEKWVEEQKKASESRKELLKAELDLVDAELSLKEAMEDLDEMLKELQKEEEKKLEVGDEKEDVSVSEPTSQEGESPPKPEAEADVGEDDDEEDDDDNGDVAPSSFGSVEDQGTTKNEQNDTKSGKSTFAALSLSFGSHNLVSSVPARLQDSFLRWKEGKFPNQSSLGSTPRNHLLPTTPSFSTVSFPRGATSKSLKLRCARQMQSVQHIPKPTSRNISRRKRSVESGTQLGHFNVLSLHNQVTT